MREGWVGIVPRGRDTRDTRCIGGLPAACRPRATTYPGLTGTKNSRLPAVPPALRLQVCLLQASKPGTQTRPLLALSPTAVLPGLWPSWTLQPGTRIDTSDTINKVDRLQITALGPSSVRTHLQIVRQSEQCNDKIRHASPARAAHPGVDLHKQSAAEQLALCVA